MKKIIAIVMAAVITGMALLMTSCSENSTNLEDYDLDKYVNLCEYKGVEITRRTIVVGEDDVRAKVNEMLDGFAETVNLKESDVLQLKDTISVTYVGRINGEYEGWTNGQEFANTDDNADTFTIGSGGYIPGFEDKFIGYHPGDTYSFEITFPANYTKNPKLSGVNVTFSGTVKSATRNVQPEYTDAFVAENTDYDTIAEYEAHVLEELQAEADENEKLDEISAVWNKIMTESEAVKYPDAVVNARYEESMANFESVAKSYSMSTEDLAKAMYNMTLDEFKTAMESQCKELVFEEMVLLMIIQRENITISDKEYTEGVADYAEKNGASDVSKFEEQYGEETLRQSLLWDKTLMFLLERADVSDAPVTEAETNAVK